MKKDWGTHNFEHKRRSLIEYMKVKLDEGDWHGVSDAANDLRVLEAQQPRFKVELDCEYKANDLTQPDAVRIVP